MHVLKTIYNFALDYSQSIVKCNFNFKAMRNIFIIVLIFIFASCTTTKYVDRPIPVETIKTEYINTVKVDSVVVKDSVDRWLKGDTLFIYKEKTRYRYINNSDTIVRVDTIPKLIKQEVTKEIKVNELKWYQNILMWIGGICTLLVTLYLTYKIKFK